MKKQIKDSCCFKAKLFPWIFLIPILWFIISFWYYKTNIQNHNQSDASHKNSINRCIDLLVTFIDSDKKNNISEVKKLQKFLNSYENENLIVNGVFGDSVKQATIRFQKKYKDDILKDDSNNFSEPTGNIYRKTRNKINEIYCSTPDKLK